MVRKILTLPITPPHPTPPHHTPPLSTPPHPTPLHPTPRHITTLYAHHTHIRCFRVTSLPWYQRKAAGLLGTLPTSTYEEAISYFEASEAANSRPFTPNWLFLGKCYMQLKNWAEAKKWLTKVLEEGGDSSDPDHKEVTFDTCQPYCHPSPCHVPTL